MSNTLRGDVEVEFFGRTYSLKPEYEAIIEVEEAVGDSVPAMFSDFIMKARVPSLKHMQGMFYGCLRAQGKLQHPQTGAIITLQDVGKYIRKMGYSKYQTEYHLLLIAMVSPEEAQKDEEAKAKKRKGKKK